MSFWRRRTLKYECDCSHSLAFHERQEGGGYGPCHYNPDPTYERERCACQFYIGDLPAEDYLRQINGQP